MKFMNERRQKRIEKNILKNRNYKVLIYNRFIITLALVLLQVVLSCFLLFRFYDSGGRAVLMAVDILSGILVLYIINRNEKPSTKLNWVIIILVFPFLGVSMYLLFGEGRPTRRMNKRISAAKKENADVLVQDEDVKKRAEAMGREAEACRYLINYANYPVYDDGEVTYYPSGKEMFRDMLAAMESAEKFILAEYFIIAGGKMWDTFRELLIKKAKEGVQIRLIFDDVGSLFLLPPKYDRYIESLHENIKCFNFNPVVPVFTMRMNNRDHRKILVVDGKTGFTGGINLADEYIDEKIKHGKWKDTGVRITGKAVNSFTMMFFNIWNAFRKDKESLSDYIAPEYSAEICSAKELCSPSAAAGKKGTEIAVKTEITAKNINAVRADDVNEVREEATETTDGVAVCVTKSEKESGGASETPLERGGEEERKGFFIQPYDDSPLDRESVGETVYLDIINRAEKYLYIFTPYLILDDFMRTALCNAAKRGVDVRIVTPGIPDKKMVFRLTRSNYAPLIKSGARIYEYTPGFIHAKSMVSDDISAVVGTINLDYRSLYLHFENAVYFSRCSAVSDVKKDGEAVFAVSRRISLEDTRQSFVGRLIDSILRVFETLM